MLLWICGELNTCLTFKRLAIRFLNQLLGGSTLCWRKGGLKLEATMAVAPVRSYSLSILVPINISHETHILRLRIPNFRRNLKRVEQI